MDIRWYRQFLEEIVIDAFQNSNGTNSGISEYLSTIQKPGRFFKHREEKMIALAEVRKAFDEHRHWPTAIVLSHLGIEDKELISRLTEKKP